MVYITFNKPIVYCQAYIDLQNPSFYFHIIHAGKGFWSVPGLQENVRCLQVEHAKSHFLGGVGRGGTEG